MNGTPGKKEGPALGRAFGAASLRPLPDDDALVLGPHHRIEQYPGRQVGRFKVQTIDLGCIEHPARPREHALGCSGLILVLVFMRLIDTRARTWMFYVGAVSQVAAIALLLFVPPTPVAVI